MNTLELARNTPIYCLSRPRSTYSDQDALLHSEDIHFGENEAWHNTAANFPRGQRVGLTLDVR